MREINGSSAEVSKVIDAIEFHTSILALNAAIAAADAGERPSPAPGAVSAPSEERENSL